MFSLSLERVGNALVDKTILKKKERMNESSIMIDYRYPREKQGM